ncbi:hypothetical protein EI94DRAFT_1727629 [Lactarius quietus]|nr:hypothetical protein EI94DRAFT_1727629 [Lactarius quietus]
MKLTSKNVIPGPLRIEGERGRTLSAGDLHSFLDMDLPSGWGSRPLVQSKATTEPPPPSGLAERSKRLTPWLFRRVNAPASLTTRHPETAAVNVIGSVPSSRAAQESYPIKETATGAQEVECTATDSPAVTIQRSLSPTRELWPNRPNRITGSSDAASNMGRPCIRSAAAAATEERCPLPDSVHPPSYRSRELSPTPTPPPYSAASGSFAPSKKRQPQDRSRNPSSARGTREPRPSLALPSDGPVLSESALSRIRAAYKVSNELGNAVMLQEMRIVTPLASLTPRVVTRRFVSVTDLEGLRKVHERVDRRSGVSGREVRQRALSKPMLGGTARGRFTARPLNAY